MTIALKLLAFAAASAVSAAAPDWRFVSLSGFSNHVAAVYIDAGSIERSGGRARFALIKVIDERVGQVDNLTTRVDTDCTTHSYREFSIMGNDGLRRVIEVPDEDEVIQAEPDTVIYAAIDMACGAEPLDPQTIADPIADAAVQIEANAPPSAVRN